MTKAAKAAAAPDAFLINPSQSTLCGPFEVFAGVSPTCKAN